MKYLFALMVFALAFPVQVLAANSAVPRQTVGRVLLQVEQRGEAWYVDPVTETRYYLKDGPAAYEALRTFGLGITTSDLHGIPIGYDERVDIGSDFFSSADTDNDGLTNRFENAIGTFSNDADSDDDGYTDGEEIKSGNNPLGSKKHAKNSALVNRLSGRILLQVEDHGEAWYVNPVDGKRYYMTDGPAAYSIMRYLSLGITDADLDPIPVHVNGPVPFPGRVLPAGALICAANDFDCFADAMDAGQPASLTASVTMDEPDIHGLANLEINYMPYQGRHFFFGTILDYEFWDDYSVEMSNEDIAIACFINPENPNLEGYAEHYTIEALSERVRGLEDGFSLEEYIQVVFGLFALGSDCEGIY